MNKTVHYYRAQQYREQMIQHFILLRSTGVCGKQSPVDLLWIYILCPCWCATLYRPMLILAFLITRAVTDSKS